MTTPCLAARRLSIVHPGAIEPVIDGFDLDVARGEIIALIGASGVGKSSLLRTLAGLQRPQKGDIVVDGTRLVDVHPRVALAFQDACLLPWLSAERNVAFGLDFDRQPKLSAQERRGRVDAAIREVGLDRARALRPAALSGGMAQRVALARCLARQPSVLLLDEPFGALDEVTRADMQELLLRVVAEVGAATVLVTHDIDEALRVADRIVLLGGAPAHAVADWTIEPRTSREDAKGRSALRAEILARLRRAARREDPAMQSVTADV